MALTDLGIEFALSLPESPQSIAEGDDALCRFLTDLDRPIGIIAPREAADFVITADIKPYLPMINALRILSVRSFHNPILFRVKADRTDYSDEVLSHIGRRSNIIGRRSVSNLIIVEDQFLFGHSHETGVEERTLQPLNKLQLDRFNAIGDIYLRSIDNTPQEIE